jgi:hypothetical protein
LLAIVPTALFPPGRPFTLQLTLVFVVLVTVAVNVTEFPSKTEGLDAETVTLTVAGGGGGGAGGVPEFATLPQPKAYACMASSANSQKLFVSKPTFDLRERGRMPWPRQAKGQRRGRERKLWMLRLILFAEVVDLASNQQLERSNEFHLRRERDLAKGRAGGIQS